MGGQTADAGATDGRHGTPSEQPPLPVPGGGRAHQANRRGYQSGRRPRTAIVGEDSGRPRKDVRFSFGFAIRTRRRNVLLRRTARQASVNPAIGPSCPR